MKAFVIFRDRVTYGRQCVAALQQAGLEVFVIDHGSTWQPALDWLPELVKNGVPVIEKGPGHHPRDLWGYEEFRRINGWQDRYIVTDPDVVPAEGCPADWVAHLSGVLDRFPAYHKAGLGLRLDNLPDCYPYKGQVLDWENQYWTCQLGDEPVFHANIDTTLAMHIPLMEMGCHSFAGVRSGYPYVADHLGWHEDLAHPTEEMQWYHDHGENVSHWTRRGRADLVEETGWRVGEILRGESLP